MLEIKEEKPSHFSDSFPYEATTVALLPKENCTECTGIIQVLVATHTKSDGG